MYKQFVSLSGAAFVSLLLAVSVTPASDDSKTSYATFMDPIGYVYYHLGGDEHQNQDAWNPTVQVGALGTAKGVTVKSFLGRDVATFRSIPYAHKPAKFEYSRIYNDTQWPTNEEGVFDATRYGPSCPHLTIVVPIPKGDEDCLSVTVYTPVMNFTGPTGELLPVMVYIHGGAFVTGEAKLYDPDRLMDQDVVVAIIQYRLSTLGFLYSGTLDAPGNMGLMDQVTALRWVKQYISYFGGDSELITVFGQSAGGASASYMQITPLTGAEYNGGQDLIQHYIAMSGSALEYWALEQNEQQGFIKQVNATGCLSGNEANVTAMVACMKTLDAKELVRAAGRVYMDARYEGASGNLGLIGQVPVTQDELIGVLEDHLIVLRENPMKSLRQGRFKPGPVMSGTCRDEGSLITALLYKDYLMTHGLETDEDYLRDGLLPFVAQSFGFFDKTQIVPNSFRLAFFPRTAQMGVWDDMSGPMVDLTGALFLKSGVWTTAHEMTVANESTKAFFYSFEFDSDNSVYDYIFIGTQMPIEGGITHSDDLMYLFTMNMPTIPDDRETEMIRRMTTLYANFAKYGDPTPDQVRGEIGQWGEFADKWQPYTPDMKNFMLLKDNLTLEKDFLLRWNYNKFGYTDKSITTSAGLTSPSSFIGKNGRDLPSQSAQSSDDGYLALVIIGSVFGSIGIIIAVLVVIRHKRNSGSKLRFGAASDGYDNFGLHART